MLQARAPNSLPTSPRRVHAVSVHEFHCPITLEIMADPVVASDGFSYERDAIEHVMKHFGTSPMTREPLSEHLFPNRNLKQHISDYEEDLQAAAGPPIRQALGSAPAVQQPHRRQQSSAPQPALNMAALVETLRADAELKESFGQAQWMALDDAHMQYELIITEMELSSQRFGACDAVGAQRAFISELCKLCSKSKVVAATKKTAERRSRPSHGSQIREADKLWLPGA